MGFFGSGYGGRVGGGGGGGGVEGEGGGGEEGDEGGGGGVTFSNGGQGDPGLVSASTYSKAAGFCFSPLIGMEAMSPAESSLKKYFFFGLGSFEKRVSIFLSSSSIAFLSFPLDT